MERDLKLKEENKNGKKISWEIRMGIGWKRKEINEDGKRIKDKSRYMRMGRELRIRVDIWGWEEN